MKKSVVLPSLFGMLFNVAASAQTPAPNTLDEIIGACEECHAAGFNTQAYAPSLNGMQNSYMEEQLSNFRAGSRGASPSGEVVMEMVRQAKSLTESELSRVVDYYSDQKRLHSPETVNGDSNNGKLLYEENCAGCHAGWMGRRFTKSPYITHLEGPYLLQQLQLFASDKRSFVVDGKHKRRMTEVSKIFSPQELSDIAAYIKSQPD